MSKVSKLCQKDKYAKFFYGYKRMMLETKIVKVITFLISAVPIVLNLIPTNSYNSSIMKTIVFITTMISFAITIISELAATFLSNHKEKAIMLKQLYECGITSNTFSKIEYDREMTNALNELAIRKSATKMTKLEKFNTVYVPEEIDDKYAYLYICRTEAASNNFLMSRMNIFYYVILIGLAMIFVSFAILKNNTQEFLQLIVQFYPLIVPVIKDISSANKTMRYCIKISADVDNYFAANDPSPEELSRFNYYVQNLEFEALFSAPVKYVLFYKINEKEIKLLEQGVTKRFIEALGSRAVIVEKKANNESLSVGGIQNPNAKIETGKKEEIKKGEDSKSSITLSNNVMTTKNTSQIRSVQSASVKQDTKQNAKIETVVKPQPVKTGDANKKVDTKQVQTTKVEPIKSPAAKTDVKKGTLKQPTEKASTTKTVEVKSQSKTTNAKIIKKK